jgi:hypothetical protein
MQYNTGFPKSNITLLFCIHISRPSYAHVHVVTVSFKKLAATYIILNIFSEKLKYTKTVRRTLQNILLVKAVKAHGGAEVYLHSVLALDERQRLATRPGRLPLGLRPPVTYLTSSQMVSGVRLENF